MVVIKYSYRVFGVIKEQKFDIIRCENFSIRK